MKVTWILLGVVLLIYDIRCGIAHLKYKQISPQLNDDNWNIVISTMCVVIRELYDLYKDCLTDIIGSRDEDQKNEIDVVNTL